MLAYTWIMGIVIATLKVCQWLQIETGNNDLTAILTKVDYCLESYVVEQNCSF